MSNELVSHKGYAHTMERLEALKKSTASGREYWLAREIAPILGYEAWRRFEDVIQRAIAACEVNQLNASKHFVETDKMVALGNAATREVQDYFLSRAACYLIAMNGEPSKPEIAA